MSHFYATASGAGKTRATRQGHKSTGIETFAASYDGAIKVTVEHNSRINRDHYRVFLCDWPSGNIRKVIASGFLGDEPQ